MVMEEMCSALDLLNLELKEGKIATGYFVNLLVEQEKR
jgi:hypothetical protein